MSNRKEEVIRIDGGKRSFRRPNITVRDPRTGKLYRENVGQTTQKGEPVAQEREALDDIELETGERPGFEGY